MRVLWQAEDGSLSVFRADWAEVNTENKVINIGVFTESQYLTELTVRPINKRMDLNLFQKDANYMMKTLYTTGLLDLTGYSYYKTMYSEMDDYEDDGEDEE